MANESAAADSIASHIANILEAGAKPESICVVAPSHRESDSYSKRLRGVCPGSHEIETGKADEAGTPRLSIATNHRVKGLEFDHVILAGRSENLDKDSERTEQATQ